MASPLHLNLIGLLLPVVVPAPIAMFTLRWPLQSIKRVLLPSTMDTLLFPTVRTAPCSGSDEAIAAICCRLLCNSLVSQACHSFIPQAFRTDRSPKLARCATL